MKLEQSLYDARPSEERERVYQVGDLENLSATQLYWMPIDKKDADNFGIVKTPMSYGRVGTSNFKVHIPKSNVQDKGIKISSPHVTLVVNSYKRIEGKSGVDYFNRLDNSLAGRITGLNSSEIKYLKNLGKKG